MEKTKVKQVSCPQCGKPNELDEWNHSETGELIQATLCISCNADFAKLEGRPWRLIKQFNDGE